MGWIGVEWSGQGRCGAGQAVGGDEEMEEVGYEWRIAGSGGQQGMAVPGSCCTRHMHSWALSLTHAPLVFWPARALV